MGSPYVVVRARPSSSSRVGTKMGTLNVSLRSPLASFARFRRKRSWQDLIPHVVSAGVEGRDHVAVRPRVCRSHDCTRAGSCVSRGYAPRSGHERARGEGGGRFRGPSHTEGAPTLGWSWSGPHVIEADRNVFPDLILFADPTDRDLLLAEDKQKRNFAHAAAVMEVEKWTTSLDSATPEDYFPTSQTAGYVLRSRRRWGILTNGRLWRLYDGTSARIYSDIYEIDLPLLLQSVGADVAFLWFYAFFAAGPVSGLSRDYPSLADHTSGSNVHRLRLSDSLREQAFAAASSLVAGIHATNPLLPRRHARAPRGGAARARPAPREPGRRAGAPPARGPRTSSCTSCTWASSGTGATSASRGSRSARSACCPSAAPGWG